MVNKAPSKQDGSTCHLQLKWVRVPTIQYSANGVRVPSKYRFRGAVNTSKEKGSPGDPDICRESQTKKLFGQTKNGPYHRPTNIKYSTHLGIMISWLKIRSGMAGMWSFFSLAKFMIWNSTSLIDDSNAARLVLVSSRAFPGSIFYKMLLLHSSMIMIASWRPWKFS